jgi:glycerol-3-phosphate dehydrogenase (NAD(P)+)
MQPTQHKFKVERVYSFLVLGAGSWGSALALHLHRQGHQVTLWGHHSHNVSHYLPGIDFPKDIQYTSDLAEAFRLSGKDPIVLLVVPSMAFDEVTQAMKPFLSPSMPIIWGTKGLSSEGEWLEDLCRRNTGERPMGILSGPSFALEVAKGMPTALTLAMNSESWGKKLQEAFHGGTLRVYLSQDMKGVQLGGIIKNIIAIAVGMSDGLGYGANARSALITRGLAELGRLGQALGAQTNTFMGLSGIGDMVLTCTDNQSRNRRYGLLLGEGKSSEEATQIVGKVVEGKVNVKQVMKLAQRHQVEMPICEQVQAVLYQSVSPKDAVNQLLTRSAKSEN